MEDLKNKLLKLMWVPETKEIIWDMQTEEPVPADNGIYKEVNSVFNLEKWSNEFKTIYSAWLDEDNEELYDITNAFYKKTLEHLEIVNKNAKVYQLYLWFDVDRTLNESFLWKNCPLTQTPLVRLPENYHYLNRFISRRKFLVLPDMQTVAVN
jgi:hypothetical protein